MRLLVLYPVFLAGLITLPSLMISMISSPEAECFDSCSLRLSKHHHLNGIISKNRMLLRPLRPHHNLGGKIVIKQKALQQVDFV